MTAKLLYRDGQGADAAALKDQEPMLRDAIVRAAYKTPFTRADSWKEVDGPRLTSFVLSQCGVLMGKGKVASVEIVKQIVAREGKLDASGLYVRRIEADGTAMDWRFEPYWVRIDMDDPPGSDSLLTLVSHGLRVRVGTFLTLQDRINLARALRNALKPYQ